MLAAIIINVHGVVAELGPELGPELDLGLWLTRTKTLLVPGVEPWIREASRLVPMAALGAGSREDVVSVLKEANLFDRFTAVIGTDEIVGGSLGPAAYLLALDKLNNDLKRLKRKPGIPGQTLTIEATDIGIVAAKAAGMKCLAVGHVLSRSRLGGADAFATRLSDSRLTHIRHELF